MTKGGWLLLITASPTKQVIKGMVAYFGLAIWVPDVRLTVYTKKVSVSESFFRSLSIVFENLKIAIDFCF